MFNLKEDDTRRFILRYGENSGRKLDHVNLERINSTIKEVYESE
jgi:transcriptional accessory protein Tex/SPT6